MTFYKAVRPDGTDFHTGTVRWAPEQGEIPEGGFVVTHPTSPVWGLSHATHLCASVTPTDCIGFKWPVAALVGGLRHLGAKSFARLADARLTSRLTSRYAALDAIRYAALEAIRDSAWDVTGDDSPDAVQDATVALVAWDLITPDQRDILTAPIRIALPDLWAEVSSHLPDIR